MVECCIVLRLNEPLLYLMTGLNLTSVMSSKRGQIYKKARTVWFHLYQVWKQAKFIYGVRSQNSGYPGGGVHRDKKGLCGVGNVLFLVLSWASNNRSSSTTHGGTPLHMYVMLQFKMYCKRMLGEAKPWWSRDLCVIPGFGPIGRMLLSRNPFRWRSEAASPTLSHPV